MDPSYNNPFGSFGANSGQPAQPVQPSQPILSPVGSGDIVLPGQPKKKKTGLIIGIILILIVVVLGIAAAIVFLAPKKNNTSYEQKFNVYANYLLDGEEKESAVAEFTTGSDYYIDDNYENPEYIKRLKELFDDFYASTSNTDKYNDISLRISEEKLDFLEKYSSYDFADYETMNSVYQNRGKEETETMITQMYGLGGDISNENEIMLEIKQLKARELILKLELSNDGNLSVADEIEEIIDKEEGILYSAVSMLKAQCLDVLKTNGGINETK